jgi:glutamate dehydrogenase/leucine dehydrogenase
MPYVMKSLDSVFNVLAKEGLTTLEVFYNRQEDKFKFDIIMGLANNQIRATSQERATEIARQLTRAGILCVAEWAYNIGGVLAGWAEYIYGEEASFAKIKPLIELICRDNLRKLLDEAKRVDKIPAELIYDKVEDAIHSGTSFNDLLYEGGVDVS